MGFSCLRTLSMGVYTPVYVLFAELWGVSNRSLWWEYIRTDIVLANRRSSRISSKPDLHGRFVSVVEKFPGQTYEWYCANALVLCLQWFAADYIAIFRSCTSVWQGGFSVRDATLVDTLESVACWKSYDDLGVSFLDCPPSYILDLQETYARTFFCIVSTVFVTVTLAILAIANGTLCSSSMTINCARV
ncbi:hypothetical protein J3Q64DRAFT_1701992 [Phycomyces blakesleeanus]|uniref:Uncharacterized protein n=1 Tax=Phycomyces blakesleeanus TaxID=4837 RepID=A0ABR3AQF2_PHYBL